MIGSKIIIIYIGSRKIQIFGMDFFLQKKSKLSSKEFVTRRDGNRFETGLRQNLYLSCFMMFRSKSCSNPVPNSLQLSSDLYWIKIKIIFHSQIE